jgi:hypothetical protein
VSKLPLERTDAPGIYRRGSKYVVVYRVERRQRKQYAGTLAEARAIKLERDGEARALRRGPTLRATASVVTADTMRRPWSCTQPPKSASRGNSSR